MHVSAHTHKHVHTHFGTHCFEVRDSLSRAALCVFAQNWIQRLFVRVRSVTFLQPQSDLFEFKELEHSLSCFCYLALLSFIKERL